MLVTTEHRLYKNMAKKGKGNILKYIRTSKGLGKGLIAGAIVLLFFSLPVTISLLLAKANAVVAILLSAPGTLLLILGIYFAHKRAASWISYYQEQTGFSEGEIQQVNLELSSPSTAIVTCQNFISAFFTEHYVVMNDVYPYVRRLEDIIAVAFSDSTDIWFMAILSTRDQEAKAVNLHADTQGKRALCMELMQQMCSRNPRILCGQDIVCDGRHYILERDGAQILRLYQEGRPLELAK